MDSTHVCAEATDPASPTFTGGLPIIAAGELTTLPPATLPPPPPRDDARSCA